MLSHSIVKSANTLGLLAVNWWRTSSSRSPWSKTCLSCGCRKPLLGRKIQTTQLGNATAQSGGLSIKPTPHRLGKLELSEERRGVEEEEERRKPQIIYKIFSDSISANSKAAVGELLVGQGEKPHPVGEALYPGLSPFVEFLPGVDLVLAYRRSVARMQAVSTMSLFTPDSILCSIV